ncbi:hypothetical protein [Mesorhizobium sp. IMUNJ 23232]|uniref:hypothetical protein n=1 Tax=Mesorhizobium sp. IMUNJ 23232 TaxID=3376064 RepID=UPI0037AA9368
MIRQGFCAALLGVAIWLAAPHVEAQSQVYCEAVNTFGSPACSQLQWIKYGQNGGTDENGDAQNGGGLGGVAPPSNFNTSVEYVNVSNSEHPTYGVIVGAIAGNGGTGAYNEGNGGDGGFAGGAQSVLTLGAGVTVIQTGNPPSSQWTGVITGGGVLATAQGGTGGYGGGDDYVVAGNGGSAGGAEIDVTDANVSTSGDSLAGLVIFSLGGFGGTGGCQAGEQIGNPGLYCEPDDSYGGNNGGYGGSVIGYEYPNGQANEISVTAATQAVSISTDGTVSPAIAAYLVGGAGGPGGTNSGYVSSDDAGYGGAGGDVTGDLDIILSGTTQNPVTLQTNSDTSPGISALSLGGAGGWGGSNGTQVDTGTGDGGDGGAGGSGGLINISLTGTSIVTAGDSSPGIVAQSAGGIGNWGGVIYGQADASGGNGGDGGDGGEVTITLDSASGISTQGTDSSGIIAQSLSGAGGSGGSANGVIVAGGNGGDGGDAGDVTVANYGSISTKGTTARGILVQSIAGAGGSGGSAWTGFYSSGGTGASSGTAGTVTVQHNGSITTLGANAQGILAQSIGGLGGAGGQAGGVVAAVGGDATTNPLTANGGSVDIGTNWGSITTSGISAIGLLGQSIGGGGGDGGGAGSVFASVGGTAGAGGAGGTVSSWSNYNTAITTNGDISPALVLQSIGGGGGNAGNASGAAPFAQVSIGGSGGNGGNGGWASFYIENPTFTTVGTKSPGLVVQSIGGGGGTGGNAFAGSVGEGFSASVAVGGSGGSGGAGLPAQAQVMGGTIATGQNPLLVSGGTTSQGPCPSLPCNLLPVDDYGVVVQSIGGGGGHGGSASAQSLAMAVPTPTGDQVAVSVSAALGGTGKTGGNGGAVNFALSDGAKIITAGQGSTAVLAQSIGGGGGAGGDSSALAMAVGYFDTPKGSDSVSVEASFAVGGNGGSGGTGGAVTIALGGTQTCTSSGCTTAPDQSGSNAPTSITTYGDFADGLVAQSIGGGGGNAGFGSSNTQAYGTGTNGSLTVTLGSQGGTGGAGGSVWVDLYTGNSITTWGSGAVGLVAQSVGGGGGASQGGSIGVGTSFTVDDTNYSVGVNVNLGSTGGSGSTGGAVTVSANAPITTHGGDATGLLAQSIGGGGGLGGSAGSDASADNPVIQGMDQRQALSNWGNYLQGKSDGSFAANFNVSVGGKGGTGGNGNSVWMALYAPITTAGDWANGAVAQSIGGGGGKGGSAAASGTGGLSYVTVNTNVAVGGKGGAGGSGGPITVYLGQGYHDNSDYNTNISTAGFGAAGVIAQSIGGGGGIGADGSDSATGVLSVGGTTDGSSGPAGDGGTVTVSHYNPDSTSIATTGDAADGVILQSIGGGGGMAGAGSSLFVGDFQQSGTLALSAGGGEGSSGDGGAVTFHPDSNSDTPIAISTAGNNSFGILAQSIGGGGGIVTSQPSSSAAPILTIGGNWVTGASNNGGTVFVGLVSEGTITTTGIGAHGIVAQSIGGGGGVIRLVNSDGDTPALNTDLSGLSNTRASGYGGAVNVTEDGSINVFGAGAVGILAQSIGAGGGLVTAGDSIQAGSPANWVGGSVGSGGTVSVTTNGPVAATGLNGIGIFAQSTGPTSSGNGQVAVTVNGNVIGGSGAGATYSTPGSAGIVVDSPSGSNNGNGNQVTVNAGGSVNTVSGRDGTVILASGGGYANVTNDGTITGSTYLGGGRFTGNTPQTGSSAASVAAGGTFKNYGTYHAGAMVDAALLANRGTVNIGLPGEIRSTHLTGDFIQTESGRLGVSIDSLNDAASHLQVDGAASIDGVIVPTAITLLPGSVQVVTAGDLDSTAGGLDSLVFRWDVAQSENTLSITPRSNFTPDGVSLTDSQASLANHFSQAWQNADTAFAKRFANLSQIAGAGGYAAALDEYSSKDIYAPSLALINSAGTILGASMSCPVFVDQKVLLEEDNCLWLDVSGRWSDQDGTDDIQGYDVTTTSYRIGAQQMIAPDWYLGGSFAYGQSSASMDGGSSGNGDTFDGSVALRHTIGPWFLAGSVALAHGSFDVNRQVNLPGFTAPLESDPSVFLAGARLRAGYQFAFDHWYVRPYGDLDLIYTHLSAVEESGSQLYALDLGSSSDTNVALSLMVEVGGRLDLDAQTTLRPYAAFGVSYLPDNTRTVDARFASATLDNGTFTDYLESPDLLGRIDLGLQLYSGSGFEVKAGYTADIGESFLSQTASARVGFHF